MEIFSVLLDFCAGNSPVTGESPSQRPVTRSFDVIFHISLTKRLRRRCYKTTSRSLWRYCNVECKYCVRMKGVHNAWVNISSGICTTEIALSTICTEQIHRHLCLRKLNWRQMYEGVYKSNIHEKNLASIIVPSYLLRIVMESGEMGCCLTNGVALALAWPMSSGN